MKLIKLLVMSDRMRGYIGMLQFAMIAYLFIIQTEFNLVSTLAVLAVVGTVLMILDYRFVFPKQQEEVSLKNPIMIEMLKRIKSIERTMIEKEEELIVKQAMEISDLDAANTYLKEDLKKAKAQIKELKEEIKELYEQRDKAVALYEVR